MRRAFTDLAFTPAVRDAQTRYGSRERYAAADRADDDAPSDRGDRLTAAEVEFIAARDGFFQATASETGWPYVQFRGGPPGFLRVLDAKTIGYADFRGNLQYLSVGHLAGNDRVALILMDHAARRRLKVWGRARVVDDDPALLAKLAVSGYRARPERAVLVTIEAFDWNCPQHITPRFTAAEIARMVAPLERENSALRARLVALGQPLPPTSLATSERSFFDNPPGDRDPYSPVGSTTPASASRLSKK